MPKREITVPVLPIPDVPNNQKILFDKESLQIAIDKFMGGKSQPVMLQKEVQIGDAKADVELDKLCGSVVEMAFDEDSAQYTAVIKLIPNKNSAFVLNKISEGVNFTLGTNKMGRLDEIKRDENEDTSDYPEDAHFICPDGFDIISTSLLPETVMKQLESLREEASAKGGSATGNA